MSDPKKRNGIYYYEGTDGWHWQCWHDGEWLCKSTRPYETKQQAREAAELLRNNMLLAAAADLKEESR